MQCMLVICVNPVHCVVCIVLTLIFLLPFYVCWGQPVVLTKFDVKPDFFLEM